MADLLDPVKAHSSYINQSDWRCQENSNNISSFGAYQKYLVGEMNARIMKSIYGEELGALHDKGALHIHDMSSGICNYCFGGSLETLLSKGITGVPNLASSTAPKHFDSACNQIASSILGFASEISGAVAYGDFNTYLAPLLAKDGKESLEQSLQNLVFNLNQNTRFSSEPCFSNLTLNLRVPAPLANKPVVAGKEGTVYGEYENEAETIALKLLDIMIKGDAKGNAFTYPLITINVSSLEDLESPVAKKACELSAKTGNCYFANFINSNLSAEDTYSLCCRLRLDRKELIQKQGLFGAQANTGSIGVVTLSMPYIASEIVGSYPRRSIEEVVEKYCWLASAILEKKREVITERLNAGFYPHLKESLPRGFDTFFSTIGLVGMEEAYGLYMQRWDLRYSSTEGKNFAQRVIQAFVDASIKIQEKTGHLYNIEATPAESACYSLARKYNTKFNSGYKYFTNSSNLKVSDVTSIGKAVSFYDKHLSMYTGGSVYHILCDDSKLTGEQVQKVIGKVLSVSDIPYVSVTPLMYSCLEHGAKDTLICPDCGKECETYTRITGYVRPVSRFNKGKVAEHENRVYLDLTKEIVILEVT